MQVLTYGASPMPTTGSRYLITFTYYQTAHVPGDYARVTQAVDIHPRDAQQETGMLFVDDPDCLAVARSVGFEQPPGLFLVLLQSGVKR
jgi:hypothetical protein